MLDEMKPNQLPTTEDEGSSPLDIVTDLALDSTIPAPIRKNALKALDRLCSAVIDLPVGALERRSAEKRSESEGRIKIREEITAQIVQQMKVPPEYARRAGNKFAEKIIRERVNLDAISAVAINELNKAGSESSTDQSADSREEKTINDDWLNSFENEASQKSTQEMQLLFGRILAGEIKKPGLYSIKTVKLLGELDQSVAILFRKLCSVSVILGHLPSKYIRDARVCFLNEKLGKETLIKYGFGFDELNILEEYGLVRSSFYESIFPYHVCIANHNNHPPIPFHHQGQDWILVPLSERAKDQGLNLSGIAFSKVSCELFRVVDQESMDRYMEDLKKFFAGQNLQMIDVHNQDKT